MIPLRNKIKRYSHSSAWEGKHRRTNMFAELKKDALGVKPPEAETLPPTVF